MTVSWCNLAWLASPLPSNTAPCIPSVHACVCVWWWWCVCVCVGGGGYEVQGIQYYDCIIKSAVCSPFLMRYDTKEMTAIIIITIVIMLRLLCWYMYIKSALDRVSLILTDQYNLVHLREKNWFRVIISVRHCSPGRHSTAKASTLQFSWYYKCAKC